MKKKPLAIAAVLVLALSLVSGIAAVQAGSGATVCHKNIVDVAQENGNFTSLVAAVEAAGLNGTLSGPGPFTVFAPTDAAFAKLGNATVDNLLKNDTATLKKILTYHVVAGEIMAKNLTNGMKLQTVEGQNVTVTINQTGTYINNAKVIMTDVPACNGVIHVIDTVLIPPAQPTLLPATPVAPSTPTNATTCIPMTSQMTIAETAVANGNFTKLVAALQAAGLVDALNGPGPFTVFAPTDAAFAKLDPSLLNKLLTQDTATLKSILLYHVVPGCFPSSSLTNGECLKTLEGQGIQITIMDGKVFANNAQVVVADIHCSNGIIHVIDTVLIPPS